MQAKPSLKTSQELQQKLAFAEHVKRITNQIHAASDLDQILLDLRKDILSVFDAEDLTIFAFDPEKKEIFSRSPTSTRRGSPHSDLRTEPGGVLRKISPASEHRRRVQYRRTAGRSTPHSSTTHPTTNAPDSKRNKF